MGDREISIKYLVDDLNILTYSLVEDSQYQRNFYTLSRGSSQNKLSFSYPLFNVIEGVKFNSADKPEHCFTLRLIYPTDNDTNFIAIASSTSKKVASQKVYVGDEIRGNYMLTTPNVNDKTLTISDPTSESTNWVLNIWSAEDHKKHKSPTQSSVSPGNTVTAAARWAPGGGRQDIDEYTIQCTVNNQTFTWYYPIKTT